MISKTFRTNTIKTIKNELEYVFTNATLSNSLSDDSNLQSAIEQTLNICAFLEKSNKVKVHKSFLKRYNELSKKDFLIKEVSFDEENDVIDELNWLHIYCKNTYKIDIFSQQLTNEKTKQIIENNDGTLTKEKVIAAGVSEGVNTDGLMLLSQKMQRANDKLNKEIIEGKFYIFTSKPKHLPIFKFIYTFLLSFLAVSMLFTSICLFLTENVKYQDSNGSTQSVSTWTDGLFQLLLALLLVWVVVRAFIQMYHKKYKNNENFKFQFKWQIDILILIILLIFFITNMTNFKTTIFKELWSMLHNQGWHNSEKLKVWMLFSAYASNLILFGLTIIFFIIPSIMSPKKDNKAIEKRYTEMLNDPSV